MSKLINMANVLHDGTFQTPKMCLESCLENDVGKRGAFKDGKKLFIVALDDVGDRYDVSWCQSGMKMSEMLALIEILKGCVKEEMGY